MKQTLRIFATAIAVLAIATPVLAQRPPPNSSAQLTALYNNAAGTLEVAAKQDCRNMLVIAALLGSEQAIQTLKDALGEEVLYNQTDPKAKNYYNPAQEDAQTQAIVSNIIESQNRLNVEIGSLINLQRKLPTNSCKAKALLLPPPLPTTDGPPPPSGPGPGPPPTGPDAGPPPEVSIPDPPPLPKRPICLGDPKDPAVIAAIEKIIADDKSELDELDTEFHTMENLIKEYNAELDSLSVKDGQDHNIDPKDRPNMYDQDTTSQIEHLKLVISLAEDDVTNMKEKQAQYKKQLDEAKEELKKSGKPCDDQTGYIPGGDGGYAVGYPGGETLIDRRTDLPHTPDKPDSDGSSTAKTEQSSVNNQTGTGVPATVATPTPKVTEKTTVGSATRDQYKRDLLNEAVKPSLPKSTPGNAGATTLSNTSVEHSAPSGMERSTSPGPEEKRSIIKRTPESTSSPHAPGGQSGVTSKRMEGTPTLHGREGAMPMGGGNGMRSGGMPMGGGNGMRSSGTPMLGGGGMRPGGMSGPGSNHSFGR
jgi:hypothetical protein